MGRLLFIFLSCIYLNGCLVDAIVPKPKKRRGTAPEKPPPEETPSTDTTTVPLGVNKTVRRVTLDLLGRFPSSAEVEQITANKNRLASYLDEWLISPSAHIHLAKTLKNQLKIYSAKNIIQLGLTLPEGVTNEDLLNGAESFFRYFIAENIAGNRSLNKLLSGKYFIQSEAVITAFGLISNEQVFTGESKYFSILPDRSPNIGLLNLPSFRISLHHSFNSVPYRSTYLMYQKLFCGNLESNEAHVFSGLATTNLSEIRATTDQSPCITCHAQYEPIANLRGSSSAITNLPEWLARTQIELQSPINYSGHYFQNSAEIESILGSDPRFVSCFFENLIEGFFQSSNLSAVQQKAKILAQFYAKEDEYYLKRSLKNLFMSESYGISRNDIKGGASTDIIAPGFRVLTRQHLESIANYLLQGTINFSLPPHLNLDYQSIASDQIYLLQSNYFSSLRFFAYKLANAIISKELIANISASSRFVLKDIPDGYGLSQDDTIVSTQMVNLWFLLTAETLNTASETYTKLKVIYDSAYNEETDANLKAQAGWQAVIITILLSPNFFIL